MADFFDKLADNLDKGIKTVSAKGKQLLETQRLNSDLSDVRNGIRVKYQRLGEKVFEMNNRGAAVDMEELRPEIDAISADYKRIVELEASIKETETKAVSEVEGQAMIKCSACNAFNPQEAKFCAKCGAPMAAPATTQEPVCGQCGQVVKEGAKFCPKCGKQLIV